MRPVDVNTVSISYYSQSVIKYKQLSFKFFSSLFYVVELVIIKEIIGLGITLAEMISKGDEQNRDFHEENIFLR